MINSIEDFETIVNIVTSILNCVALLVGGGWVLNNFISSRAGVWNLNLVIDPDTVDVQGGRSLLIININLINKGNVKITPGPSGLVVRVKPVNVEKGALYSEVNPAKEKSIYEGDILKKYYRPKIGYNNYEMEPNSEYHEEVCLMVEDNTIFEIKAEFFYKKDKDSLSESIIYYVNNGK